MKLVPPKILVAQRNTLSVAPENDLMEILNQPIPNKTELTNTKQGVKVFVKKTPTQNKEKEDEGTKVEDKKTKESTPEMKNPLYWFGYFPPQPLVQAQKHYSSGRFKT